MRAGRRRTLIFITTKEVLRKGTGIKMYSFVNDPQKATWLNIQ